MAKLNNKGFSLVELIIAIAVFTFMITPIISQLTVSMNISNKSRALQEDSEYAEYIMEYFKSTPLDEIGSDNLFDGCNALQKKAEETTETVTVGGDTVEYTTMSFEIPKDSAVTIGKGTFYSTITLDTKAYALTQVYVDESEPSNSYGYRAATDEELANGTGTYSGTDGVEYVKITYMQDPNQTNVGNLTNLDSSDVAIIDGDASNSDSTASDAIFTMKSELLKAKYPEQWEQLMYGGYSGFEKDTVTKVTTISVEKGVSGTFTTFTVSVKTEYQDSNEEYPTTLPAYNVYYKTFVQDEPPVIYFMYNPCVYNAEYMANDYVVLDTSSAGDADVKMYLIETAATIPGYIQEIIEENKDSMTQTYSSTLIEYVDTSGSRVNRDEVVTHFNIKGDSSHIQVYTNKDLAYVNDYTGFSGIISSVTGCTAPGTSDASGITHFVKPLSADTAYEGRLYTITVTLYDASDDSAVATFTGTRGAD